MLLAANTKHTPLTSFLHNISSTLPIPFTFVTGGVGGSSSSSTRSRQHFTNSDIESLALLLLTIFLTFKIVTFLGRLVVAWVVAMVKMVFWVSVAVLGVWIYVVGFPAVVGVLQRMAGAWLLRAGLGV